MQKFKRILSYIFVDLISASIFIYFIFSNFYKESINSFYYSVISLLLCLTLYALSGTYVQITRKSRLKEFIRTFNQSILIIGFYAYINTYFYLARDRDFYTFLEIGFYHLFIVYLSRLIFLTFIKSQVKAGKIGYNTLIVGNNKKALQLYDEVTAQKDKIGFKFIGYTELDSKNPEQFLKIKNLGDFENIKTIIVDYKIEEVIIAIESQQQDKLKFILDELEKTGVIINIIPDVKDILAGIVKLNYLFSIPLITLHPDSMPFWQRIIKKTLDYILAIIVLILFSPIFLIIVVFIKFGSKGSAIYKQERIGKNGNPFYIYKFRTMFVGSEKDGPSLSRLNDPRVTSIGKILRKTRLDELPQFFNILKGEMSLVGPRPERKFYIDQIIKKAPHYHYLHKVLPGITS